MPGRSSGGHAPRASSPSGSIPSSSEGVSTTAASAVESNRRPATVGQKCERLIAIRSSSTTSRRGKCAHEIGRARGPSRVWTRHRRFTAS